MSVNASRAPIVNVDCSCRGQNPLCVTCRGVGTIPRASCRRCGGTGKEGGVKCMDCRGEGWRDVELL